MPLSPILGEVKIKVMTQIRLCLLLLFLTLDITWAGAQFTVGTYLGTTLGTEQFGQNLNGACGMSLQAMYRFRNSPFSIGLDFGGSWYDHREYETTLEDMGTEGARAIAEENFGFLSFGLLTRLDLNRPSVLNPYLEGRLGGMSFFRSTYYDELQALNPTEELEEEYHCPSDREGLGTALQTGLGGGLSLDLSRLKKNWNWFPVHLDLNVVYHLGSVTEYLSLRSDPATPRDAASRNRNASAASVQSAPEEPVLVRTPTDNINIRLGAYILFQQ